jgi:sugar-specific transcriptional regulator TrmB
MKFTIEMSGNELKTAMENGSLVKFVDAHVEDTPEPPAQIKVKKEEPVAKKQKEVVQESQKETKSSHTKEKQEETKEGLTFEEVRSVLADLIRSGKKDEVNELVHSFDAKKLSDIKESDYEELIAKAKEL